MLRDWKMDIRLGQKVIARESEKERCKREDWLRETETEWQTERETDTHVNRLRPLLTRWPAFLFYWLCCPLRTERNFQELPRRSQMWRPGPSAVWRLDPDVTITIVNAIIYSVAPIHNHEEPLDFSCIYCVLLIFIVLEEALFLTEWNIMIVVSLLRV